MDSSPILVASAWPYANGPLHLGHIASLIGADAVARFHRLKGDSVLFVSGSDCYGTPIAVEASVRGVTPGSIADRYHSEFQETFRALDFSFDFYSRTTSSDHARVVQDMFLLLHEKGYIYPKVDRALYSPSLDRFLPDRFVEGVCPHCSFDGARGDQCDGCGSLLDPLSLVNPRVNPKILPVGSGTHGALEVRDSEHFYLKLSSFQSEISSFLDRFRGAWRPNAERITQSFLSQGLRDRAITRDTDWGVPIPLPGYDSKRIYVWFDAVLGYLSASRAQAADSWEVWWRSDSARHYYVHGKDNVPFHTVILPSVLSVAGLHQPDRVFSSEYLLLEGGKISTSRGYAVWVSDFLSSFDSELLRYFLLAQGPETGDIDFRWSEFASLVNGELIGTFGNLVNRVCSFVEKRYPDGVSFPADSGSSVPEILTVIDNTFVSVGDAVERGSFREAFRAVFRVAERGNQFAHTAEPWKVYASSPERAAGDLAVLLHVIHSLSLLIQPFLPRSSLKIQGFLGIDSPAESGPGVSSGVWHRPEPLSRYVVSGSAVLYHKIEDSAVQQELETLGLQG